MKVEIMDTTLRDGEQTSGVSFSPLEKLQLSRMLLDELNVDRIEVASAMVSRGEKEAVRRIVEWAKASNNLGRIEVLGFVDYNRSVDWINDTGCRVINLLAKGSLKHVRGQLGKSADEHISDIVRTIDIAFKNGLSVNLYLEDWSNWMAHSPDYVFNLLDRLSECPIERVMLPDTLGVLNYEQTYKYCSSIIEAYPRYRFDFHAHNDYDLGTANVYAAVKAGVHGIHTTINGLGERAGNVPLSSVIAVLSDHLEVSTAVNEKVLTRLSRLVESVSGIRIPENKPLVGESVFTQTCGVHADGDGKDQLYFNRLMPERFGRKREYALGKTSGKSNILMNLGGLGLSLDDESLRKVTERVIELGDKKAAVTADDLPYIISDVLGNGDMDSPVKIQHYSLSLSDGLKPVANICLEIEGRQYEENSSGDGQYDAFMKALRKIYDKLGKECPQLIDYRVNIPPGGHTDALVDTSIRWLYKGKEYRTRAVEADQAEAAIKATQKILNIIEKIKK